MAVSKKGKRKITVNERTWFWWVGEADPECNSASTTVLTVISADSRFGIRFYLGQPSDKRFLIVLGPDFDGLPDAGGPWIRIRCPEWQSGPAITPVTVRKVIEWCTSSQRECIRVDCYGNVDDKFLIMMSISSH